MFVFVISSWTGQTLQNPTTIIHPAPKVMAEYEGPDDQPVDRPRPIFTYDDGSPVKFHIQKNLPQHMIEYLERLIADNGGTVTSEIVWKGFVLVDPRTAKGQRFQEKHTRHDRPQRYVVCYTFVAASITKGRMLEPQKMDNVLPIFEDEEKPVKVYLGLPPGASRTRALRKTITLYGGQVVDRTREAKVVIGDPTQATFRQLEKYRDPPRTYLEPLSWVKECLDTRKYSHSIVVLQPALPKQPGRPVGTGRTEYTPEEDKLLIQYIASKCPTLGGRSGNKIYKELCERPDLYRWSTTHTWQSWRNRYYKDMPRFNAAIARYLEARHLQLQVPPARQPQDQAGDNDDGDDNDDDDDDDDKDQLEYEEPASRANVVPRTAPKRPAPDDEDGRSEPETDQERTKARKRTRVDVQIEPNNDPNAQQLMFGHTGPPSEEEPQPWSGGTTSLGNASHPSTALASSTTRVSSGTNMSPPKRAARSSGGKNSVSVKAKGKMRAVQSEDSPPQEASGDPAGQEKREVSVEPVRPTRVTRQNSAQPQSTTHVEPVTNTTKRQARGAAKRAGDKAKVVASASSTRKPAKKPTPAPQPKPLPQDSSSSSHISDVSADALATEELLILQEQDEEQSNDMMLDAAPHAEDEDGELGSSNEESDSESMSPRILSMDTQQYMRRDLRQRPQRKPFDL
ncbi:hypothetical protein M407DRAFT_25049 [Tulasnella calospora MUT 4182]|uniref:DNA-binding protein RAP1 n=1 Tax=Tulasnella calospora MUT 4182 TaxID=1051891 RepID=A0A0C3QI48_9AGAM|nr:hypothetical protein M407DRAFT_25049 [Tulasnella calospora MUT 4182]